MEEKDRKQGKKKFGPFLDLCVSSLRRGHANLLCIVPILSDVPEGTLVAARRANITCLAFLLAGDVGIECNYRTRMPLKLARKTEHLNSKYLCACLLSILETRTQLHLDLIIRIQSTIELKYDNELISQ